ASAAFRSASRAQDRDRSWGVLRLLEQRTQLECRTKTSVGVSRRRSVGRPIDDPALDCLPRRSALTFWTGNAALPLARHELPTGTWTWAGVILARDEASAIERDDIANAVFGFRIVRALNALCERLLDRSVDSIQNLVASHSQRVSDNIEG